MARGYTTRKLEVWSLVAHLGENQQVDYVAMLKAIASVDTKKRIIRLKERAVAIVKIEFIGEKVYLVVDEGPWGQPLILDTVTATESTGLLESGQIIATRTHALIDLPSREAIVEFNNRGARAGDIALALERAGRSLKDWTTLQVDLRPNIDHGFVKSIDEFERIRVAGFGMGQPNQAWTDWSNEFVALAHESGAQTVGAEMAAGRGRSLSKVAGIVPYIKQRAKDTHASLATAFVTGRRANEKAETTVSLSKHIEHQRVNVKIDPDRRVDETNIRAHLDAYDAARHPPDGMS